MKSKIGDLIEIPVDGGCAYAHYVLRHKKYGALIYVGRGVFGDRPSIFPEFNNCQFICFFPLDFALSKNLVCVVGNIEPSEDQKKFPLFKSGIIDAKGCVDSWWLWDGEKEWRVGNLNDEQKKLPIRGIWNFTLLKERIQSGWTAESAASY